MSTKTWQYNLNIYSLISIRSSQMSIEKFLTHPLTLIEITGKEIENIFLFFFFSLCTYALKFSWNSLSSNTDLQISFTIQVDSFCPSTFLTIVISSTMPIVLHLILWKDKREAFSGVCPKFFGQFLALKGVKIKRCSLLKCLLPCNISSHNKGVLYLHLRWKSKLQSKRPTLDRCKWQNMLAPSTRKFTSLILI